MCSALGNYERPAPPRPGPRHAKWSITRRGKLCRVAPPRPPRCASAATICSRRSAPPRWGLRMRTSRGPGWPGVARPQGSQLTRPHLGREAGQSRQAPQAPQALPHSRCGLAGPHIVCHSGAFGRSRSGERGRGRWPIKCGKMRDHHDLRNATPPRCNGPGPMLGCSAASPLISLKRGHHRKAGRAAKP